MSGLDRVELADGLAVAYGPTWRRDPEHPSGWSLPERTLAWALIGWQDGMLQLDRQPWRYTAEQVRFLCWLYAVDEHGRWLDDDAVLQRLKGHGKDPFGASVMAGEFLGPCRPDLDAKPVLDPWGAEHPAGRAHPEPWVQTAAVAESQTKNTMKLFPGMFTPAAVERYGIDIGKTVIYADGGRAMIEAVTSSPATLEGARASFVVANETHHWRKANDGHDMADVIRRNAEKSADGAARRLALTNAYDPSQDSVAQRDREAWELIATGQTRGTGILYDSLEAGPAADLRDPEPTLRAVRGDSVWLHIDRVTRSILDPRNSPAQSRRWWFNQVVPTEDAWCPPDWWDTCPTVERLAPGDDVAVFFDGSKSRDTTALVGCRIDDGAVFTLAHWSRPESLDHDRVWNVDRDAVDEAVRHVAATLSVVALWADPSPGADEEGERWWDALIDGWSRDLGDGLEVWAKRDGNDRHACMWDMRAPSHVQAFTASAERTIAAIEAGELAHDGHAVLRRHVTNARRRPNRYGVSIGKVSRSSSRKIDLAVAMVGARMVRRRVLQRRSAPGRKRKRTGVVVSA